MASWSFNEEDAAIAKKLKLFYDYIYVSDLFLYHMPYALKTILFFGFDWFEI